MCVNRTAALRQVSLMFIYYLYYLHTYILFTYILFTRSILSRCDADTQWRLMPTAHRPHRSAKTRSIDWSHSSRPARSSAAPSMGEGGLRLPHVVYTAWRLQVQLWKGELLLSFLKVVTGIRHLQVVVQRWQIDAGCPAATSQTHP